jgi:cytochrome c55X
MAKPFAAMLAKAGLMIGLGLAPALISSSAQAGEFDFKTHSEMSDFVRQDCGACHGLSLKGGLGRPLLKENLDHFDLETLEEIILDGIPDTAMPPWRGLLDEAQAKQIAKALKEGTIE